MSIFSSIWNTTSSAVSSAASNIQDAGEWVVEEGAGPIAETVETGIESTDDAIESVGDIPEPSEGGFMGDLDKDLYNAGEFLIEDVGGGITDTIEQGFNQGLEDIQDFSISEDFGDFGSIDFGGDDSSSSGGGSTGESGDTSVDLGGVSGDVFDPTQDGQSGEDEQTQTRTQDNGETRVISTGGQQAGMFGGNLTTFLLVGATAFGISQVLQNGNKNGGKQ